MNTKNHKPNKGSFKAGQIDKRRNDKGQMKKETVALGALLKQYLTDEGLKLHDGWPFNITEGKGTKAQALAVRIWDEAIDGKFPFVQFLVDRIMGKVKDEIAIAPKNLHHIYSRFSIADMKRSAKEYDEANKLEMEASHAKNHDKPLPDMQP